MLFLGLGGDITLAKEEQFSEKDRISVFDVGSGRTDISDFLSVVICLFADVRRAPK